MERSLSPKQRAIVEAQKHCPFDCVTWAGRGRCCARCLAHADEFLALEQNTRGFEEGSFPSLQDGEFLAVELVMCSVPKCLNIFPRIKGSSSTECGGTMLHQQLRVEEIKKEIRNHFWKKYRIKIKRFKRF
jgi:hypothetical protein